LHGVASWGKEESKCCAGRKGDELGFAIFRAKKGWCQKSRSSLEPVLL
jgi:hypothetical protein